MSTEPSFATTGKKTGEIDVRLSYKIVDLFSEGLYASPNKALEELVANSFDAGALNVAVFLPPDLHAQGAMIAVVDDGVGMDESGLRQHWLIGTSNKRSITTLPRGRVQIGKFGIGKLATYVLSRRLTHISKSKGKYYSTSMNYDRIDRRVDDGVEPKAPIRIPLRELTEDEAKVAVDAWLSTPSFKKTGLRLFGKGSSQSWTFSILSNLKDKVHEIRRSTLEWVLRTALPLRDDFKIYLDGTRLLPSKHGKGRVRKWIVGKDILELPKPATDDLEISEDQDQPADSESRYALVHKDLGRITGYGEVYRDLLTGKSDEIGRSHGFFVYVLGRLINVADGHFGIKPDELRHGTFGRIRVVLHMDGLDDFLQSDRERVREGPVLSDAQNILRGIFNRLRPEVEKADAEDDPGQRLSRKLADGSTSGTRRPIVDLVRATLGGKSRSRYIALPESTTAAEKESLIAALESRLETPESFVTGLDFLYDAAVDLGIAAYDAASGRLRINGFHPFVGAYYDEFNSRDSGLPLELFAMAEVLLESQLHQVGYKQSDVDDVMRARDQFLRDVANGSGRRTALTVAKALIDARNDEDKLEQEVVAAFTSLGFDAVKDARKGKADGVAKAHLSADAKGQPRRYSVTLEAKSKKKDGKAVAAATVNVSVIALHRDEYHCEHALVVAPLFATSQGDGSSVAQQIATDRELTAANGTPKTITLIHVDDLARLVRIAPVKNLGLSKMRSLFTDCKLPQDCKKWIDAIERTKPQRPRYTEIIETIHKLQEKYKQASVEYAGLRVALGSRSPAIDYDTNEELADLCRAMSQMAPGYVTATATTVELDQSPANVVAALEKATKAHLQNDE
jgi:hypothetical protein